MTNIKEDDYESICAELDRLSILMLDVMKEYVDCKVLIESFIKTGSLHLAKARYIMGNKSVSSLQLPNEDCHVLAHTRVSNSKHGSLENLVFEIDRLSLNGHSNLNSVNSRGKGKTTGNGNNQVDDLSSEIKSVENKKSGKTKKKYIEHNGEDNSGDGIKNESGYESTPSSENDSALSKDPIKWFGFLVPQNLKDAQSNFSTCLDHVVQCANLQMKMNSIRSEYARLMQLKKKKNIQVP